MTRYMIRAALAAGAITAGVSAIPLAAQSSPVPTMVIYGAQKCPTDSDGNEIVVCVRRSPSEQFRIPKELRELKVTPENESWAAKVVASDDIARDGIGSCSPSGPGGQTGCFLRQAREARRENADKAADRRAVERALK